MKSVIKLFGFLMFINVYYCLQENYVFIPERCDAYVTKSYTSNFSYKCSKINRNELILNASFISNITITSDKDADVYIIGYQFRSNEYRKGPIEFKMGLCSLFSSQDFDLPHVFSDSNLKCPILRDHFYFLYNVNPNAKNFPKFIPEGRWKIELKLRYIKNAMGVINWYTKIEYPIRRPI